MRGYFGAVLNGLATAGRIPTLRDGLLQHLQVGTAGPAVMFPKGFTFGIVAEEVDVTARDAGASERRKTCLDQLLSQTIAAMTFRDGEVVQVSTAAIVSA